MKDDGLGWLLAAVLGCAAWLDHRIDKISDELAKIQDTTDAVQAGQVQMQESVDSIRRIMLER